jgi:hypothetical protein
LHVPPTPPSAMDALNSAIEAESFHRHVGVVWVISCRGLLKAVSWLIDISWLVYQVSNLAGSAVPSGYGAIWRVAR